jgi:hypothetical protein
VNPPQGQAFLGPELCFRSVVELWRCAPKCGEGGGFDISHLFVAGVLLNVLTNPPPSHICGKCIYQCPGPPPCQKRELYRCRNVVCQWVPASASIFSEDRGNISVTLKQLKLIRIPPPSHRFNEYLKKCPHQKEGKQDRSI